MLQIKLRRVSPARKRRKTSFQNRTKKRRNAPIFYFWFLVADTMTIMQ